MAEFHQRNEALTLELWFTVAILLGCRRTKRCFASAAAPEEYKYECEFVQSQCGWVLRNYLYLLQTRFSVAVVGYKKVVLLSSQFNYSATHPTSARRERSHPFSIILPQIGGSIFNTQ